MTNVLAVVPARGGSKRIKKKNIRPLAGKPLLLYTLDAAREATLIDELVVSTEDEAIARVAETAGVRVIKRPDELASDTAHPIAALQHVLTTLGKEGKEYELVVLLAPTSPLRTAQDIDGAIALSRQHGLATTISVTKANPYWTFTLKEQRVQPVLGWEYFMTRSQDLPTAYRPNGAVYVAKPAALAEGFYHEHITIFPMPEERSIDIDTPFDFTIAEALLTRREQ